MVRPFDPKDLYLDLRDGGALRRLPVDDDFWPSVIAGRLAIEGRLVSAHRFTKDWDGWERHPQGEEVLCLLEGAADVVIETEAGIVTVRLDRTNRCCLVPQGAWHRFTVEDEAEVLFVTPGEGTEHRPL